MLDRTGRAPAFEEGTTVVQRLRRWYADQAGGTEESSSALPGADAGNVNVGHQRPTDAGMSTVEYAVGTVVAAAFAAVLYKIVTGDSVVAGLTDLINSALSTAF